MEVGLLCLFILFFGLFTDHMGKLERESCKYCHKKKERCECVWYKDGIRVNRYEDELRNPNP